MGLLVNGEWRTDWYEADEKGHFRRPSTKFHEHISSEPGAVFAPESERYHLYVAYACPWAQRTLITRAYKKLERHIGISIVDPHMGDDGWMFSKFPGCIPDDVNGARYLREIYLAAEPSYTGRVTTPVLWDKNTGMIVNNESRSIMRMLDLAFDAVTDANTTLLPSGTQERVDHLLDALYEPVNNGVYRTGFATSQEAYEEACRELFDALDHWEEVLGKTRYLCGAQLTEADVALYVTLVRFDLVYYSHFKCNLRRIQNYENLWNYLKELYQLPAFGGTTRLDHIKLHYYWSQPTVNPTRIVPLGPTIDLLQPHNRERL